MTVDDTYKLMQDIVNKYQSGYLSPAEFNRYINQAQRSYLAYLLGEYQQYQNGRAIARVEIGMNQKVMQSLSPFIGEPTTLTIDVNGNATYPDNFEAVNAMFYGSSYKRVRYVMWDKLYSYFNSSIDPIATNPIYLVKDTGFKFFPILLGTAYLSYVSTPTDIVWGYTEDINEQPVYDPTTSVDPAWLDIDMLDIIARALQMFGISIQANDVVQYSTMVKNQGQ